MFEWASDITGLMPLVQALMSGFIAAWIYHGLTAHPKETQFERSVHALIFTALVQVPVFAARNLFLWIGSVWFSMGEWTKEANVVWSMVSAVVVGVFISVCANNDVPHRILRKWGITKRTSFPSVWYNFFNGDWPQWAVLHLKGEKAEDIPPRRLYGWIFEWPDQPDSGHFVVMRAEWLGEDNQSTPITGVDRILVSVTKVEFVEFVSLVDETAESVEISNGVKNVKQQESRRVEPTKANNNGAHGHCGAGIGPQPAPADESSKTTATPSPAATTQEIVLSDTLKSNLEKKGNEQIKETDGIRQRSPAEESSG